MVDKRRISHKALSGAGLVLLGMSTHLQAQPDTTLETKAMQETFYVSLGGYSVFRADTTMSLVQRNVGAGAAISPQDTLGLDLENTVTRLEGYYRFNPTSQIRFSWFRVDTDAYKQLDTEVDWVDQQGNEYTIAAGSEVSSSLLYDIAMVSYYWSFYHNEKVELSFGGGLHMTKFEIDLDVTADATGLPSSQNARNTAHTVPLPTIGIGLNYRVTPKLYWYLRAAGFYLKYDDWDGAYTDLQLGLEYNVWRNLGVGIGLASDNLSVTETAQDYVFRYDNRLSGMNVYLSMMF